MSDKKISELAASTTPLAGAEVLPVVQSGATKQVSVANLTAGRAISAASYAVTGSVAPTNGIYLSDTNAVGIATNSTQRIQVSETGLVGVGVIPYASVGGNGNTVQIGNPLTASGAGLTIGSTTTGDIQYSDAASGTGQYAGLLRYVHTTDTFQIWANSANRFSVAGTGDATIVNGNLVIGTAGKGIDFSADSSAAGMTSELLDDYEEGTFTPQFRDGVSGNIATAATSIGRYTKIGNRVSYTIDLTNIDTTGLTAGNEIYITGLPFVVVSGANVYFAATMFLSDVSSTTGATCGVAIQGTSLLTLVNKTTTGFASILVSAVNSGAGDIYINGSYQTA